MFPPAPYSGLFIISPTGVLRQITINDLPVGRSVDETLRLVKAFQVRRAQSSRLSYRAEVEYKEIGPHLQGRCSPSFALAST